MVRSTLSNIRKWMLTKAILVVAVIYFVWRLPKTLKNIKNQSEEELKNKTQQKTAVTGSKEEDPHEVTSENSSLKDTSVELAWELTPDEIEKVYVGDDIEDLIQKIEDASAGNSVDMKEVEEALQKILDVDWSDEAVRDLAPSIPVHMLNLGKEQDYLFSVQRKTFVSIRDNLEVIPIESPPGLKSSGNFYLIGNEIFDIDKEKVICVGWN